MTAKEGVKDYSVDRLVFFSDAVFAIAITLLALELKLPESVNLENDQAVLSAFATNSNQFIAFAVSFIVIASFWAWHVHAFKKITSYKAPFMWMNIFILFLIAIMPFTTSLISGPSGRVTEIIYATNISLIGLAAAAMLHYTHKNKFVDDTVTNAQHHKGQTSMLAVSSVFAASIPIALINPHIASYFWLLLIPIMRFIN